MVGRLFGLALLVVVVIWGLRRMGLIQPGAAGSAGDGAPAEQRFKLQFRAGRLVQSQGVIARRACLAFEDIAAHVDLDGDIALLPSGELSFSQTVPDGARQRLLNAWHASKGG